MAKKTKVDVTVNDAGSIVQFTPISNAAKAWFNDNVQSESWQWLGNALGVDHRYAEDLIGGLIAEGFEVRS